MAACSDPGAVPAGCRHTPAGAIPEGSFVAAEGLRDLLTRLDAAGRDAWRTDPDAEALLRFVIVRYAALARAHDAVPEDAAAVALPILQAAATRTAADPWAVLTTAVRRALVAEQRAAGLLTCAERIRRRPAHGWHDADRVGDRTADLHQLDSAPPAEVNADMPVVGEAAVLLHRCGWPLPQAFAAVDHIAHTLIEVGSRATAYEVLRRDKRVRAHLDLPHAGWITLLRACVGHPTRPGPLANGILARLLAGDTVTDLLADPDLVELLADGQPVLGGSA